MYSKVKEASLIQRLEEAFFFFGYGQGVKVYSLYDKSQKRIFYSRNVMFNEIRSTKQNNVKDVAEYEPSIELEMDCQSEDDNTINHYAEDEPQ